LSQAIFLAKLVESSRAMMMPLRAVMRLALAWTIVFDDGKTVLFAAEAQLDIVSDAQPISW